MAALVYASIGLVASAFTYVRHLKFKDHAVLVRIDYRVCVLSISALLGSVAVFVFSACLGA